MALEERRDALNDLRRSDALGLELLHNIQELAVHLGSVMELVLDQVKILQRVSHHQAPIGPPSSRSHQDAVGSKQGPFSLSSF